MNTKEIIEMARQAGIEVKEPSWGYSESYSFSSFEEAFERFAELVAQHERERIKQANAPEIERVNAHIKQLEDAVLAEREACAEVAMTLTRRMKETEKAHYNHSAKPFIAERFGFERGLILEGQKIANAIQARGQA